MIKLKPFEISYCEVQVEYQPPPLDFFFVEETAENITFKVFTSIKSNHRKAISIEEG